VDKNQLIINTYKQMKSKIFAVTLAVFTASCNQAKQTDSTVTKTQIITENNQQANEGYELMKTNCYVCHNPKAASHDDLIAPPFKAVKRQYANAYNTKTDFVNAIVNWVQNPVEEKALMRGAVNKFKVMPKLPLPKQNLEKIAAYIYENDVEEPVWLQVQMKEMQGKGMGEKTGKMDKN